MATITRRILSAKKFNGLNSIRHFSNSMSTKFSTQSQPNVKVDSDEPDMINPLQHPDFFQVHNLFTVKDLFDARVHYGHKEGSLHNNMRPFLYGTRLGHLIIDLDQTAELLRQALNFAAHIAFHSGIILFLSRDPQSAYLVDKTAKECNEFSHTRKWRLGTFTNAAQQFHAITRLPDLCIFLNTHDSTLWPHTAITHCAKMCIPSIGIVDTNCNPNLITYPVPGNDDTPAATELYCKLFKSAILRGKSARQAIMQTDISTQQDNDKTSNTKIV